MALLTIAAYTVAGAVLLAMVSFIPSTSITYQPALVSELQRGEDTLKAYEQFLNVEYQ